MKVLITSIMNELEKPFKDPRIYRDSQTQSITNENLLYMLIDENKRNFHEGIIVTA